MYGSLSLKINKEMNWEIYVTVNLYHLIIFVNTICPSLPSYVSFLGKVGWFGLIKHIRNVCGLKSASVFVY